MLVGAAIVLGLLSQAPRRAQLDPTLLRLSPPTELFLATDPAAEKHFAPGWIVAGVASGAATATLLTLNLNRAPPASCTGENLPDSNTGRYVAFWAIPIVLGACLGSLAAYDVPGTRAVSIGVDVAMPILGGLTWLIPYCVH